MTKTTTQTPTIFCLPSNKHHKTINKQLFKHPQTAVYRRQNKYTQKQHKRQHNSK